MTLINFLEQINTEPSATAFESTLSVISESYDFQECAFTNGKTHNAAGENNGSCKIFAFGLLNKLTEEQTLHCFGSYYRKDVLENPEGTDHQNIRNFMEQGWNGIVFKGEALKLKK